MPLCAVKFNFILDAHNIGRLYFKKCGKNKIKKQLVYDRNKSNFLKCWRYLGWGLVLVLCL